MRLANVEFEGRRGVGVVARDVIRCLFEGDAAYPGDTDDAIRWGFDGLNALGKLAGAGRPLDPRAVTYRPALARPGKTICVGLNYADHTAESGIAQPDYPVLFPRFSSSLIGHGAPIIRPAVSDALDFEGEMAVIIGKSGRNIETRHALKHVAAYSVFNDGTIRDYQFKTPQWTIGKNFDGTGAFGPHLVLADVLPTGGSGLKIETRLNGNTVQSATTADLIFPVADLVSIISEAVTLSPGDVIVTGTPSGIGHVRKPRLYMKPGDVCEVEIEQIGVLSNPIEDAVPIKTANKVGEVA